MVDGPLKSNIPHKTRIADRAAMNILIADDEPIPRQFLRFQLEQWGHTVIPANNGQQAWELLQTHDCQLVITDWNMPEMNGIELIRKIRESERAGYVYIMLLTSKSERESLVTGLTTGADDYLAKPVNKDELQARLQSGRRIIEMEHRLAHQNRALANANLKMKRDLDAAAKIQQAFLPSRRMKIPNVGVAWYYSPCTELAGDMLNVLPLDDDHVGIYILDVSGHGVQAALLAVTACRSLSNHKDASSVLWKCRDGDADYQLQSPAVAVEQLNARFVAQSVTEQFFTLVYGILNHRTGEFRYTIAGHPSPVRFIASGRPVFLSGDGLPIGIAETDYEEHTIHLTPGDRLLFYSDGVTECMNSANELFGEQRLAELLVRTSHQSLDDVVPQILDALDSWREIQPIHDDLSLVAIEYAPQSPPLHRSPTTSTSYATYWTAEPDTDTTAAFI